MVHRSHIAETLATELKRKPQTTVQSVLYALEALDMVEAENGVYRLQGGDAKEATKKRPAVAGLEHAGEKIPPNIRRSGEQVHLTGVRTPMLTHGFPGSEAEPAIRAHKDALPSCKKHDCFSEG